MANSGKRGGKKSAAEITRRKIYVATNRRLTNKIRKLKKHIKKLPNDLQSQEALKNIT